MKLGIHPDRRSGQLSFSTKRIIDLLSANGIEYDMLSIGDIDFWQRVATCHYFIFKWPQEDHFRQIAATILPLIEKQLNIPCFPSQLSSWLYDDKIREYLILKIHGLPTVESYLFYDRPSAFHFIETASFPLVIKLKSGAGGTMVKRIDTRTEAKDYISLMFKRGISYQRGFKGTQRELLREKGVIGYIRRELGALKARVRQGNAYVDGNWEIHKNYILFQEYLPDNSYDTRVVTIGNRAFGFIRYNKENDFRASGSAVKSFDEKKIDLAFIRIAFDVSQKLGFECMAYDFLYDRNARPRICEISYTFGSSTGSSVRECKGYWDRDLTWHEGPVDPEFFLLSDLLKGQTLFRR